MPNLPTPQNSEEAMTQLETIGEQEQQQKQQEQDQAQGQAKEKQAPQEQTDSAQTEETVYVKEIDFGDGNKVTFEGSSPEELENKITAAYVNAVKRNRQQRQTADPQAQKKIERKQLSNDELFAIDQEFQNGKPTTAIQKFLADAYGLTPENFAQTQKTVDQIEQQAQANAAGVEFVAAHPEYVVHPKNQQLIEKYMQMYKKPWTLQGIEECYDDLLAAGLLITDRKAAVTHQATTEPPQKKKVAASGLFGKQGAAAGVPAKKRPMTEAEIDREVEKIRQKGGGSDQILEFMQSINQA